MNDSSTRTLDRLGAAAGVAAVLLLLVIFTSMPALPAPNKPVSEIVRKATADRDALLLGAYLGALLTGALLVFGASFAARLRRAEGDGGGWWLLALAGIAGTAVGIVSDALVVTFVRAVGHGARGDALWIGYGGDHWIGVLTAIPLAVFFLGAGCGARESGLLPRWLTWLALGLAGAFVLGGASVTGGEVDGGVLGTLLVLAYLGLMIWIVGTSVSMLRRPMPLARPVAAAIG